MTKPKVVIVLRGGLVNGVLSDQPLDYVVVDYESDKSSDGEVTDIITPLGQSESLKEFYRIHERPDVVEFIKGELGTKEDAARAEYMRQPTRANWQALKDARKEDK